MVDLADSTAYDKHDIEDGLIAGMFSEEQLYAEVPLWRESCLAVEARHAGFLAETTDAKLRITRVAGELIRACIRDLLEATWQRLQEADLASADEVRDHDRMLVGHGPEMKQKVGELQRFLHQHFYRHEHLRRFERYADRVLTALFDCFLAQPEELAPWYRSWADEVGLERAICDYLAGMTDRFAEQEYERLVD